MADTIASNYLTADRVKLPLSFSIEEIQSEAQNICKGEFLYYDSIPLRAPAHLIDPTRPFPEAKGGYADGSWCDWLNASILEQSPYLKSIVEFFQSHTKVTLVRLLRLASGSEVREHTDPTLGLEIEESVVRLTIPIYTNDKVIFYLNGTPVPMLAGECWYLRLTDPHKIENLSTQERINLTIDMIPNDWVRNLILNA